MAVDGVYSIIPTAFTDSHDRHLGDRRRAAGRVSGTGVPRVTGLGVTGEAATWQKGLEWISV